MIRLFTALLLLSLTPSCSFDGCVSNSNSRHSFVLDNEADTHSPSDSGQPSKPSSVHALWQEAKIDHARFMALASNKDAYRLDVENRYPRIFQELEIDRRIPTTTDSDKIKNLFRESFLSSGLKITGFELLEKTASIPEERDIPEELGPNEPFAWLPDEVRREQVISIRVAPPELDKLEKWFRARGKIGPLFLVKSVSFSPDSVELKLNAYRFVEDVPIPRRRADLPRTSSIIDSAQLDEEELEDPRIKEIVELYDALSEHKREIDEALRWRSETQLLDVKMQFFTLKAKKMEDQRWTDILR